MQGIYETFQILPTRLKVKNGQKEILPKTIFFNTLEVQKTWSSSQKC